MQISIANIIRGTLIGNTMSVLTRYISRVVNGGGIVEAPQCVETSLNSQSLLQQASLLVVPSGYKGGTLYSEIPTNGNGDLTWTRGSDAFRTNASGLIQRVPWNLLSYSEEFSNAYWNKITSTITANTTTAPNGTLTADTLNVTAVTYSGLGRAITGVSANYNVSIYAKKNTKSWLYLIDVQGTGARAWFDLDNGVLGTVANGYTATITNVGDGWYRCTLSNNNAQALAYYQLGLADANNGITPTSSGSAFIWGAQLVEGTTAQTYLPTTDRLNFPRLDYTYGSCPAVLAEPQRTNLCTYSNAFTNASWLTTNITVSDNSQTGIDGNTSAALITTSSTSNFLLKEIGVTAGTVYTFSFYIKRGTMTDLKYRVRDVSNSVDIVTPTSYYSQTNASTFTRISVTITAPTGCTSIRFYPFSDTGSIGTAILTQAQVEAGSYATTIIPTTTASATRVADSFSRNNIYTNGLITASGGTWFVELRNNIVYTRDGSIVGMYVGNTTLGNDNSLCIRSASPPSRLSIAKYIGGVFTQLYLTTTDTVKIAIKWNGTSADVFVNGVKQVSATAFTPTNMEFLATPSTQDVPKFIQQMALYTEPLTDTKLIELTTI
jgi:hypothetical protein